MEELYGPLGWMDCTYNSSLDGIHSPIIKFPDQTQLVHQILVFLKVFMVTVREINEMEMILVRRLRVYLISCYMAIGCVMIALSPVMITTALPMFMFCYACQVLMLFSVQANIRRCISFLCFVFCCMEISGFEFLYDVYLILCFAFKSLYCLSQVRDQQQKERSGLQRVRDLMFFVTDAAMLMNTDFVDYRFILFGNAFVAVAENINAQATMHVAIVYLTMMTLLIGGVLFEFDLGEMIDEVFQELWKSVLQFIEQ